MKPIFRFALLGAMLALPLASFAQYSQQQGSSGASSAPPAATPSTPSTSSPPIQEHSKRCDTMTGAEKDQCLKDEAEKTDSKGPSDNAATGASGSSTTSGSGDTIKAPPKQEAND